MLFDFDRSKVIRQNQKTKHFAYFFENIFATELQIFMPYANKLIFEIVLPYS